MTMIIVIIHHCYLNIYKNSIVRIFRNKLKYITSYVGRKESPFNKIYYNNFLLIHKSEYLKKNNKKQIKARINIR